MEKLGPHGSTVLPGRLDFNVPRLTTCHGEEGALATGRRLWASGWRLRVALIVVFIASAALRGVLILSANPVLVSDGRDYHVLALNLAQGNGFMQTYQGETEVYDGFTFRAYRPPGYPLLLSGLFRLFGPRPQVAWIVNVVADLITQICFLLIAFRLLGKSSALFVQVLLAVHVLWTPNFMTESVYTALFGLIVLMVVFETPMRGHLGAIACGAVFLAALFVRPITVSLLPVLAWKFVAYGFSKKSAVRLGLVLLPSVIAVSLWAHRNYQLFGQVVFLTTNLGAHNADAVGIDPHQMFRALRDAGLNEAQINTEFLRAERQIALANPGRFVKTWALRACRLFSLRPAWEVRVILWENILPTGPGATWAARFYRKSYAQYYVIYPLAAVGACVLLWRRCSLSGLWLVMLSFVVIHAIVSRSDIRLVAPLYPLLCVLAGACWPEVRAMRGRPTPTMPTTHSVE